VRAVEHCPRCGRAAGASRPCPHCGRYVAPLAWFAVPPTSAATLPSPRPARYAGPPRYRFIPRWGFPPLPWIPPGPKPPPPRDALTATRATLGSLGPALWATATVAALWRYVLLLASRSDALPAGLVAASDALVTSAATVAPIVAVLAGVLLVAWSVCASRAAGEFAGVVPARSGRAIVAGWVVPVANLSVPGSVLAEIEHAALARPVGERPRPSGLLQAWWVLWVANLAGVVIVALWSLRTSVQAQADGVVLHAVLDLLAAATAGATAVLAARLTRLLTPSRGTHREVLVAVR
jgi:hypothetical protein